MATRERFCRCGKPLEQSQTIEGKPARWPKYCSDACRQAAYREDSPTTVYRLFDADGGLLYVGCTNGVKARFKTHQATKEWWTEVVLADLEHYPNRQQAIAVEAEAIRSEGPKYNAVTPIDVDSSPVGTRLVRIMIQLEPETIEQVDKIRGAVPRAAWVRLLIEDRLKQSQVYSSYQLPGKLVSSEQVRMAQSSKPVRAVDCWQKKSASVSQQEENRSEADTE